MQIVRTIFFCFVLDLPLLLAAAGQCISKIYRPFLVVLARKAAENKFHDTCKHELCSVQLISMPLCIPSLVRLASLPMNILVRMGGYKNGRGLCPWRLTWPLFTEKESFWCVLRFFSKFGCWQSPFFTATSCSLWECYMVRLWFECLIIWMAFVVVDIVRGAGWI